MLKLHRLAVVLVLGLSLPAGAGVRFGPVKVQAGESVRMVAHTESKGGTIETSRDGKWRSGTMRVVRDRELFATVREPGPEGMLRVMLRIPKFRSISVITLDGQDSPSLEDSPLVGKLIAANRDKEGNWKFELDGTPLSSRGQGELDELAAYQKRQWYPDRELNVGDSWEFDPAWIKLVIQRDLAKAQTIGTMKLAQLQRSLTKQTAVIEVSIRSTGKEWRPDGRETGAAVNLQGKVVVNLANNLDEKLDLEGTVSSTARKGIETTKLQLPLQMEVRKTIVKGGGEP